MFILLSFGRIHKCQFDSGVYSSLKIGDSLKCKIVSIKKGKSLYIELTARAEHLSLPAGEISTASLLNLLTPENKSSYISKSFTGVIKSIQPTSIKPLYIEFGNACYGHATVFGDIFPALESEKINEMKSHYSIGDIVEVWVKDVKFDGKKAAKNIRVAMSEALLKKPSQLVLKGQLVTCRIIKDH